MSCTSLIGCSSYSFTECLLWATNAEVNVAIVIVVSVFICTCFLFCIANYCYSAIRLLSHKCEMKLSVSVMFNYLELLSSS